MYNSDWLNPKAGYRGGTPPAPPWLPQFVPGLEEGKPIKKLPATVPSGQQWSRTPYSHREGLRGYMNWASGAPGVMAAYEDLLDAMLRMLPKRAPARAARRATARQR